jgi:hypothetical protein
MSMARGLSAASGLSAPLRSRFRGKARVGALILLAVGGVSAQESAVTMKQIMLDLIHPASNDILVAINRGSPKDDKEWAAVRRSALTLVESRTLLTARVQAADWAKYAGALADAGSAAYKAAQAKDAGALAAVADSLDASCTACHKQYRPNVFPSGGQPK